MILKVILRKKEKFGKKTDLESSLFEEVKKKGKVRGNK